MALVYVNIKQEVNYISILFVYLVVNFNQSLQNILVAINSVINFTGNMLLLIVIETCILCRVYRIRFNLNLEPKY